MRQTRLNLPKPQASQDICVQPSGLFLWPFLVPTRERGVNLVLHLFKRKVSKKIRLKCHFSRGLYIRKNADKSRRWIFTSLRFVKNSKFERSWRLRNCGADRRRGPCKHRNCSALDIFQLATFFILTLSHNAILFIKVCMLLSKNGLMNSQKCTLVAVVPLKHGAGL